MRISASMFIRAVLSTVAFYALLDLVQAREIEVGNADALPAALEAAQPGDVVVLADGEYRDQKIVLSGQGTEEAPITVRAATPGKVIVTGKSILRIGGEYLVVDGLVFSEPDQTVSDVVQFRVDSDELAHHCRLTNSAMSSTQLNNSASESRWLGLYGSENRVDHCSFAGKSNKGTTCVVWLGDDSHGKHQIDHNYFGHRENLGQNGGETIRVGDSKTSMLDAKCVVENNLFEKCNGEAECISNKSCGNIYRSNTFLEVSGALTLRHGNGCLVESNVFLGKGARRTGGVRIIGEDHVVRGNYMENLTGDDGRSALSMMMGIPNSPAHRYTQVKRARIENNSLVDCKHSVLIGLGDDKKATLAPIDCTIRGNNISSPKRQLVEARCDLSGITWQDNHFVGKSLGIDPVEGIATIKAKPIPLPPIERSLVGPKWQSKN